MSDSETIECDSKTVGCDGGGGALGHPLVYLEMGENSEIVCPYCSCKFILKEGVRVSTAH